LEKNLNALLLVLFLSSFINTTLDLILFLFFIEMSSPSLKDLPKVAFDLKNQLEGFNPDNMKKADTNEKIILPTAEGNLIIKN